MVEVEVVLEAEGQWEWAAFSKEVCQSYAQLEMVLLVVHWADLPYGPQDPGQQHLVPPQAGPLHLPPPTRFLQQNTHARTAPRCLTSPSPPAVAATLPAG